MKTLMNKVALVTSATRGIGFASALKLAQEGAIVYLGVRRMEDTQEICDRYTELKMIPVYFDARTKLHLQNYLASRTDNNPALFVTLKAPFNRLTIGGVEKAVRKLGEQAQISKVHPHKFRRTLATVAIDKGMPIEQVQNLLGHKNINTTMQYAMVNTANVKN